MTSKKRFPTYRILLGFESRELDPNEAPESRGGKAFDTDCVALAVTSWTVSAALLAACWTFDAVSFTFSEVVCAVSCAASTTSGVAMLSSLSFFCSSADGSVVTVSPLDSASAGLASFFCSSSASRLSDWWKDRLSVGVSNLKMEARDGVGLRFDSCRAGWVKTARAATRRKANIVSLLKGGSLLPSRLRRSMDGDIGW